MARHRKDLGARKHVRVELYKPGFLIPAPEAAWIECQILDVSDQGCVSGGGRAGSAEDFRPRLHGGRRGVSGVLAGLAQGRLIGARFVSAKELRQGLAFADADLGGRKAPAG